MIEFAKAHQINLDYSIDVNELENILKEEFDYQINETELEKYQEIKAAKETLIQKLADISFNLLLPDVKHYITLCTTDMYMITRFTFFCILRNISLSVACFVRIHCLTFKTTTIAVSYH